MKRQNQVIKQRNSFYFLIIMFLATLACHDSKRQNSLAIKNDFEKIFSNIELDDTNNEVNSKIYEDSIIHYRNHIRKTANKIKQFSARNEVLGFLKKDSIYFELNLNNNINLIYSSYNGFSEGSGGEKAIYCDNFYIDKLKQHLMFLKGINYNLLKKTNIDK